PHLQVRLRPDQVRLRRGAHRGAVRAADGADLPGQPRRRRQRRRHRAGLTMRQRFPWLRHAILVLISLLMLLPFYWVLKTSVATNTIYAYPPRLLPAEPHLFNFIDVWYLIPFPRYMLNSVIVSALAVAGNVVLNAMAGYALTRHFPGRRWIMAL